MRGCQVASVSPSLNARVVGFIVCFQFKVVYLWGPPNPPSLPLLLEPPPPSARAVWTHIMGCHAGTDCVQFTYGVEYRPWLPLPLTAAVCPKETQILSKTKTKCLTPVFFNNLGRLTLADDAVVFRHPDRHQRGGGAFSWEPGSTRPPPRRRRSTRPPCRRPSTSSAWSTSPASCRGWRSVATYSSWKVDLSW